jgi:hypothetical protein
MVTMTSSTQSAEEMKEALEKYGQTVVPAEPDSAAPSVTPAKASESPSAEPPAESAPVSETEKKPQETQAAKPGETPPAEPKPQRANFESRRKALERQVDRLQEERDLDRASRTRVEAQLAEAQAELAKFKPAEAPKDIGPVRPVRPAFPRREADDYDGSKYEAAVAKHHEESVKYDDNMEAYRVAMNERTLNEGIAKRDRERAEADAKAALDRQNAEIRAKIAEQSKAFEDFGELVEAMPEEPVPTTKDFDLAVELSENPAILIRHFMLDFLDHESVDRERLLKLPPHRMVMELGKLEDKLVAEHKKPTAPKTEPPADAAPPAPASETPPKPPERPARVPRQPQPDAPIEPVGSRGGAAVANLSQATNARDYARLRSTGVNR